MISRSEIDQSHSELDLRMNEGDPINFKFWIRGAEAWASASYTCVLRKEPATGVLASPTVAVAASVGPEPGDGNGLNVDITNVAVATLTAANSPFMWGMKEIGGGTKYAGLLYVEPRYV